MPIQFAGLAFLVMFAGTFGARWAVLAAGLVLLFIGFALSGVRITLALPSAAADRPGSDAIGGR